jgi:hypothetical protein
MLIADRPQLPKGAQKALRHVFAQKYSAPQKIPFCVLPTHRRRDLFQYMTAALRALV